MLVYFEIHYNGSNTDYRVDNISLKPNGKIKSNYQYDIDLIKDTEYDFWMLTDLDYDDNIYGPANILIKIVGEVRTTVFRKMKIENLSKLINT